MQRVTDTSSAARFTSGFTLMELMITLALAGVLLAIAVPNMRVFGQNNRLTAASNDLLRSFQMARSEAIKRQQNVAVCASADPTAATPACSYGAFNGWIVFQDTNGNWQPDGAPAEPILERHERVDPTVFVRTDNDGIESFNQTGFANPAGARSPTRNIVLCDSRGVHLAAGSSTARAVVISPTGRTRVTKDNTDVTNALGVIGASCP